MHWCSHAGPARWSVEAAEEFVCCLASCGALCPVWLQCSASWHTAALKHLTGSSEMPVSHPLNPKGQGSTSPNPNKTLTPEGIHNILDLPRTESARPNSSTSTASRSRRPSSEGALPAPERHLRPHLFSCLECGAGARSWGLHCILRRTCRWSLNMLLPASWHQG